MHTIRAATDNFSDGNKLGQGGFGAVYKVRNSVLMTIQICYGSESPKKHLLMIWRKQSHVLFEI